MAAPKNIGWERSAAAWIASQGAHGDFTRQYVLDPVMTARIAGRGFVTALDIGCGEGRFVRMMAQHGIAAIGIDPTPGLIEEARRRDPTGDYRIGHAEALDIAEASVDLVVSYLSLIDIEQMQAAIAEMARVLKPGGTLLIANLNGFNTAGADRGWIRNWLGQRVYYPLDRYLEVRGNPVSWKGIAIVNWHRPMSSYMKALLGNGLRLVFFDEPAPVGGDAEKAEVYRRAPYAHVMEWYKP